jgi:hypothetical protein
MIWSVVGFFCVTGEGLDAQEMRKKARRRVSMKKRNFLRTIFPLLKKNPAFGLTSIPLGF